MTANGHNHLVDLEGTSPFVGLVAVEGSNEQRRFSKRGSLEAFSFRVLELLEGLNEREAETIHNCPTSMENKLSQFQQKLQDSNSGQEVLTEFRELKECVMQSQSRKINSSLLAELVETVQVLLHESSPHQEGDSSPTSPGAVVQKLISRIGTKLTNPEAQNVPEDDLRELQNMLHTLEHETKKLIFRIQNVDEDRGDLIRLVSSGQELLADMVKENEALEHQLTLHIASQSSLVHTNSDQLSASNAESQGNSQDGGTTQEETLLRELFKEKSRAEMFEKQAKNLAMQATSTQYKMEQLKAENRELVMALDQASWMEDRDRLLQVLEEEKDKVSTWTEEFEDLSQQLKAAQEKIKVLEQDKFVLQRAIEEKSWSEDRSRLLFELSQCKSQIQDLTKDVNDREKAILEDQKIRESLENEIKEREEKQSSSQPWKKLELSLKLDIAEKQNKLFEVSSELEQAKYEIETYKQKFEDYQSEIENLHKQVQRVEWAEEKNRLCQALEEEIEKRCSWEEERVALDQQVSTLMEEIVGLKAANATLVTSVDEVSWSLEKEELCEALEEEKEKFSSWREEMEALEEENKELKKILHESNNKDLIIKDKNEALEHLAKEIENLQSKVKVQEYEINALSGILSENPESWIKEKIELLNRVSDLELSSASMQDALEVGHSKNQKLLIRIEELEIELDRVQRELNVMKSLGTTKKSKHVSWGSNQILEACDGEVVDYQLPPLSINIKHSNSRFGEELSEGDESCSRFAGSAVGELRCDLTVRIPHQRSKSIPPTIQL